MNCVYLLLKMLESELRAGAGGSDTAAFCLIDSLLYTLPPLPPSSAATDANAALRIL